MQLVFNNYFSKTPAGMKSFYLDRNVTSEDFVKIEKCPCCKSRLEEVFRLESSFINDERVYLGRGLCKTCGYLGCSRTFSPEWVDNYYRKEWTNSNRTLNIEMTSNLTNIRPLELLEKVLDKDAFILDAGAGYGSSIKAFYESGYKNLEALELSERRVDVLRKRYNIKVDNTPLEKITKSSILKKKYDAVYLWHVFEHLTKLEECCTTLAEIVKDDGYLYIAVPFFPEEHSLNLVNLHVHWHSFQDFTLNFLMSRFGFELVDEDTTFDGGGIKALYKKTGPIREQGDFSLLPSPKKIRNSYNEKIFKDFQLMYLIHEPKNNIKNIALNFYYNSSFAGTELMRYPMNWIDFQLFKLTVWADDNLTGMKFHTRVLRKIIRILGKRFSFANGTAFTKKISGLPKDEYPFRSIFNKDDIIKIDFVTNGPVKVWLE